MGKYMSAPETARLLGMRPAAAVLMAALAVAAAFYFPWRLGTFNPEVPILSWIVYLAEVGGLISLALHLFMTAAVVQREPQKPIDGVTVDLFVTTYNEPVTMLRRTLAAAKQVRRATRIVLLDDGNRPQMRKLAEEMGVDYIARTDNTHAKAGNLNNALAKSKADFVATFDADHAPAPDFLEQTLGYFRNEHVAFVQTPQDFYNLDSFQHRRFGQTNRFWTEQSLFFRVIQPGKDRWNASFYCGSCAVLRRVALDRVGGFAVGTITEDLHTSLKLHKAGYASVYHNASLAYGIAPSTYEPYETQRIRWGQGAMQVWRKEGLVFTKGLTLPQRLCYLASVTTYFDAWQKLIFYALPAFVLITGVMPLAHIDWQFLARFLPWFALTMLVGEELGRGYARSIIIEQYNFLRLPAFLRASMALFIPSNLGFKVTRKAGIKPGSARGQLMAMAVLPAISFLAIPVALWRYSAQAHLPIGALLANILWALLLGTMMAMAVLFAWRRNNDRRADYRFTAPLPFDVHLPSGGWGTLRALDLTPEGARLAAPMGLDLSVGQKVEAIIRLPGANAPVTLRIRHREAVNDDPMPQRMEIGCAVQWKSSADQDRLSALLYGAGLEQRLLDLSEQGGTPLDLVGAADDKPGVHPLRRAWAPGVVQIGANSFDVAAQPINDNFETWRVLSYEPIPQEAIMRLPRPGAGESGTAVRVTDMSVVQAGDGVVHVTSVEIEGASPQRRNKAGGDPYLMIGAAVAFLLALIGGVAQAHGETIGMVGVEGGQNSTYAYVGGVQPLTRKSDGSGWAARVWMDRLEYSYEQGGAEVKAEAVGGEGALVRQWSGEWGYANMSVGARYRHTELDPFDPGNPSEGGHWDASLQFDGRTALHERWGLIWLAARSLREQDSIARLGVDHDMGGWRIGADAQRLWGRRYGESQVGLTAAFDMGHGATLTARAGASRNDDDESGGYVGLGLSLNLNGMGGDGERHRRARP